MELEVKNLSFEYKKNNEVLKNISFNFKGGNIVAIIGTNGAGKSTLIKCLASIYKVKEGEILIDKKNLLELKNKDKSKYISYVPQIFEFPNQNVYDSILIGRKPYINLEPTLLDLEIVDNIIKELKLENIAFKNINEISGGEKQKVAIARALVQSSSLILLDEPTSNLDVKNQLEVIDILKNINKNKNLLIFVIMHDINLALKLADKFILLKDGKLFKSGDLNILTEENLSCLYDIKAKIINYENNKFIYFNKE